MPALPDETPKRVLRSSKPATAKPRPAPRRIRKKRTISSAATVEDSTTSVESEDTASGSPSPEQLLAPNPLEDPTVPPIAFLAAASAQGQQAHPSGSAPATPRCRGRPAASFSSPLSSPFTARQASAKLDIQRATTPAQYPQTLRTTQASSDDEGDAGNAAVESRALVLYRKPPAERLDRPTTPDRRPRDDRAHVSPILDSDDSSEEPPPQRQFKDMFSSGNHARFISRSSAGDMDGVEAHWQLSPSDIVPIVPLTTRVGEAARGLYDTPQRKIFVRRRSLATASMDLEQSHLYDAGFAEHEPCPDNPDGRPWVEQYAAVSNEEWRLGHPRVNRFTQPHLLKLKQAAASESNRASTSDAAPVRVQPPRKSSSNNYHSPFQGEELLEGAISMDEMGSAEDDEFVPSPSRRASSKRDEAEPLSAPTRVDKGKAPQRPAHAGPSGDQNGRPSVEVTEELERVGHRMQAEVSELADKFGLTYDTVLRKIGFARQQEVREPNLANIFRKVHKHRLAAASKPTQTTAQYNAAFKEWQQQHGNDPDAVTALLQEHTSILATSTKTFKPSDIPKRVSVISQQMADMSNSYFMTNNIVVVGAVIHLGAVHAAQTFAPNMGQQVALVNGFDIDQEALLLKAKALLLRVEIPSPKQEQVDTNIVDSRWVTGASPRDDYRIWVKGYLKSAFAKATNPSANWNFKKFPKLADIHEVVLTGWGPNMRSVPNHEWTERTAGGLTLANWQQLVWRIPSEYQGNPHHRVEEGELSLEFVPLEDFLKKNQKYAGRRPCLVDHVGEVIYFAGEDKPALAGTAPKRSAKAKARKIQTPESSASEESSEGEGPAAKVRHVSVGSASPSGHIRKRARVAASSHGSESPLPAAADRPVKSLPVRPPRDAKNDKTDKRKRKRSVPAAADDREDEAWTAPDVVREHSLAPGHFPPQDRGMTPMYPPSFPPAPFASQPPYVAQPSFPGPAYQPPFYPPTYGQQGWPQSTNANAHQPWGAPQHYTHEEMEAFLAMRRGGYGTGGPF